MEPKATFAFRHELVRQARGGLRALKASQSGADPDSQHDHISDFLNHAGVISKILKPGGANPQDPRRVRGRELRRLLGLSDNDPILDRTLRDLLEHIDEQIDSWAATSVAGLVDTNTGPVGAVRIAGKNLAEISLRHYDNTTGIYYVLGRSFDLRAIAASLELVLERAHSEQGFDWARQT